MKATRRTRSFRLALAAVVVMLFATACELEDRAEGGSERPWFCDPTDIALNDGHGGHGGHGHHWPYHEEKGPLDALDCLALDVIVDVSSTFASQFPTAAIAEANGWFRIAPWIPGQGTHHIDLDYGIPNEFDPTRPTMLMYDSNEPSGQLTGMVWMMPSGHNPPEGFLGDNDHWHAHHALCFKDGAIIGDGLTDEECEALGGTNLDTSGIWMVHVWYPIYDGWYATDIFNKEHPGIN